MKNAFLTSGLCKTCKGEHRGFTEAELKSACEQVAGISLTELFEYVYTAKTIDNTKYLAYAGLKTEKQNIESMGKNNNSGFAINRIEKPAS